MAAELRVGCFLEDVAQERLITSLIKRVADLIEGFSSGLAFDVRNATGGHGRALMSFEEYLIRWRDLDRGVYDLLIVAIDGNCHRYVETRNQILGLAQSKGYPGQVVCAVPDPHIEKWYLADPIGFQQCFSSVGLPSVPKYKCERERYKQALSAALKDADIEAPLGGSEYAEDIVQNIDLSRAVFNDRSLKHFLDDLRAVLSRL